MKLIGLVLLLLIGLPSHVAAQGYATTPDGEDPLWPCYGKRSYFNHLSTGGVGRDEAEIKPTAGVLLMLCAENIHPTANAYLKCTDATAANTTPGFTPIWWQIMIPAGGGVAVPNANVPFSNAMTCYLDVYREERSTASVMPGQVRYRAIYR